jgi:hypothetical protein
MNSASVIIMCNPTMVQHCVFIYKGTNFQSHIIYIIIIIDNVKLNSEQHVSITQDHIQALVDILLILKQSYM